MQCKLNMAISIILYGMLDLMLYVCYVCITLVQNEAEATLVVQKMQSIQSKSRISFICLN